MARSRAKTGFWKIGAALIFTVSTVAVLLKTHGRSVAAVIALGAPATAPRPLGAFESQTDVGKTLPGSAEYDAARHLYLVTGGGENMWEGTDAFHYVWRRAHGDLVLTADVQLVGAGGRPHRKAGWVVRQTLDPDSPYVSAVVHGDGLTAMQFRTTKGGITQEVRSTLVRPLSLRLERTGDTFTLSAAMEGQPFQTAGSAKVELHDPVYIGLAVCAHDPTALETAVFSDVTLEGDTFYGEGVEHSMESRLEVISVDGKDRRLVYKASERFEAPNWSRDGKYLLFNEGGRIYTLSVNGGEPKLLDTGIATNCNNDHGLSPDGKWLAVSNSPHGSSLIYIVPSTGGEVRQVTEKGPSYWHGWSPDGKTLAYCAERNGNFDVYTIPAEGGAEKRLTEAEGLDDGPDYSPDGRYIYFNSERTGLMQIWRMHPDGSDQEQITRDGHADWFAHPSPDGKWLVFISFDKNVKTHPPNHDVMLRLLPLREGNPVGEPRVLVKLFGGQGTINVPSWSPDSKQLAFVSYRLLDR
jgi:TolB protein